MVSVGIAYFMLWKRKDTGKNVEDEGIIGTPFPLGLRGNADSINYSLIHLEKSNIHFNQNHITTLLFYKIPSARASQHVCLPRTSLRSLLTDWIVTFTSIKLIQFHPIQSVNVYQLHWASPLLAIQFAYNSDPVLEEPQPSRRNKHMMN